MPADLGVLWLRFVADFPRWWLEKRKKALGNSGGVIFLDFLNKTIADLGRHCLRELHTEKPKSRSKEEGDPEVFAKWVRRQLDEMVDTAGKSVQL